MSFTARASCALLQASACAAHVLGTQNFLASTQNMNMSDMSVSAVSKQIEQMAEALLDGPTKSLLHSFKICGQCQSFQRLGEANDGGYLTCVDGLTDGHMKGALSMGIKQHDKWSLDVFNLLKVPVVQFDCTVSHPPVQNCPSCQFFQACIKAPSGAGAVAGKQNWALQHALDASGLGQTPERSLVMKMDIEGSEWPIFAEMVSGGAGNVLKKFQQVAVEFHGMDQTHMHTQYLQAMQHLLDAGLRVVHVHGNNFGGTYWEGACSMPNVVEVTFLAGAQASPGCCDPQPHALDAVNNPANPVELPSAHLP